MTDSRTTAGPRSKTLLPPRHWMGPSASLLNPTVFLLLLVIAGSLLNLWAYQGAHLAPALTVLIATLIAYIAFTVMHDSVHRSAHRSTLVNNAMGYLAAIYLLAAFPLFKRVHQAHHLNTNNPELDPDYIVARKPHWLMPIWNLLLPLHYRWHYYGRKLWRTRGELLVSLMIEAFYAAAITLLAIFAPDILLRVWLIPSLLAIIVLGFAFNFLPHAPHLETERFRDTRILKGRIRNVLFLGQNYHLVHHLWTSIPWYRNQSVYNHLQNELADRGAVID